MTEVPDEPYDPNPVAPYPPPSQYPPYGPYPQNPPYPPYPYGGYPPNGWYPGLWNDPRPSAVLGSAVVAYIGAGLLVLAGILLFFGATVVSAFSDTAGDSYRILTTELFVDGLVNLVAAGLLVGGGVALTGRSARGRTVLTVGCGIVIVEAVYWTIRSDVTSSGWAFTFGALAVISLVLSWTAPVHRWLRGESVAPPAPQPPVTR